MKKDLQNIGDLANKPGMQKSYGVRKTNCGVRVVAPTAAAHYNGMVGDHTTPRSRAELSSHHHLH